MESKQYEMINQNYVNKERIQNNLKELAKFGLNSNGGIDRSFGSSNDIAAREWLSTLWQEAFQSKVEIDPVANMWTEVKGQENLPPIVLGSHHDAVANGGMYDGALGVLLATEVIQTIKETNYRLRHPIRLVSFSAEEPNPYNVSTLGSRSITGKLKKEDLEPVIHSKTKVSLKDTIKKLGGNVDDIAKHCLQPDDIKAFLECHIEQGRNLYDKNLSLAVVTQITGIYREKIKIIGEANHSGTTLMHYRHDALLAGADLSLALEKIMIEMNRNDVVGTIGNFNVIPNSANIIPGEVNLIVEVRTSDDRILENIISNLSDSIVSIEEKRGVQIFRDVILNQKSIPMDKQIRNVLKDAITSMGETCLELPSMAGHDAVHMASVTKAGMLFVPSIDGKSHCPDEKTNMDDIEKAGNVLLQTVLILDKELD